MLQGFHTLKNTGHTLPPARCTLQAQLDNLVQYSQKNGMLINKSKTKVMIFNPARRYDALPQLTLSGMGGENLEVVEQFKLLGLIFRSDNKWYDNTQYICQKGYTRLWMLRRLKGLGASVEELMDVYYKQVRSVLEMP